jgi:hypothetical protein
VHRPLGLQEPFASLLGRTSIPDGAEVDREDP